MLGLFFASSVAGLFVAFPSAIIGAMMFLVGMELAKFARHVRPNKDLAPMGATVIVSLLSNMAWGFVVGLAAYHLTRYMVRRSGRCACHRPATSTA